MSKKVKKEKSQLNEKKVKQPVEAVGWSLKAEVIVHRFAEEGKKFFQPEVTTGENPGCGDVRNRYGFKVISRSRALAHAFDYCNAHKMRVMSVRGVREDKYILW